MIPRPRNPTVGGAADMLVLESAKSRYGCLTPRASRIVTPPHRATTYISPD